MLQFIQSNRGTLIAVSVIAVLIAVALIKIIKDRKAGVGSCGEKCSECSKGICPYGKSSEEE